MESRLVTTPTPHTVESFLNESKRRDACLALYTRCQVQYDGRATSQLQTGDRFILRKPDGAILVHGETNHQPRNWQPPGATTTVTTQTPLTLTATRTNPDETVRITCQTVYHLALMPMDDAASVQLHGSEDDLRTRLFDSPSLIEPGFRPQHKEYDTPAGPVDVWGYDADGRPVILELKRRRAGPDAVSQLRRYVETVNPEVRGILVAPSLTDRAEQLLERFELESRRIAPPTDSGTQPVTLTEFTNTDTDTDS